MTKTGVHWLCTFVSLRACACHAALSLISVAEWWFALLFRWLFVAQPCTLGIDSTARLREEIVTAIEKERRRRTAVWSFFPCSFSVTSELKHGVQKT